MCSDFQLDDLPGGCGRDPRRSPDFSALSGPNFRAH